MANETFPYLTSLHVNDCYAYQDFDIPIGEGVDKPFRHLILTGKNGSGKTTVLRGIDVWVGILSHKNVGFYTGKAQNVIPKGNKMNAGHLQTSVYRLFEATREFSLEPVSSPTSEQEFTARTANQSLSKLLKLYLVNQKIDQAFDIIEKNGKSVGYEDKFFDKLESIFQSIFEDKGLKLVFARKEYEFYLQYSGGRKVTFNQLSSGFSAFVSIVLELLVRVDMIQTEQKDYTLDPSGIVLIDEPEAHLHLEMQYQVMPLLTSLFPNVQFIVATHSPAVASSIKDATVFDLTTKEVAKDWVVGSSYSELMQTHFGLDNEFSNIADDIMDRAKRLVDSKKRPEEKAVSLKKLLAENGQYLSPAFHLALESTVLQLEEELELA